MTSHWPRRISVTVAAMASLASVACDGPSTNAVTVAPTTAQYSAGPGGGNNGNGNGNGGPSVTTTGPCTLGYPYNSSNARTSMVFNESEVLAAFGPAIGSSDDQVEVWYSDENAMTLGVASLTAGSGKNASTQTYPLSALTSNPGHVSNPDLGMPGAVDGYGRPIYPSLFITDITTDASSKAGDWQFGGAPLPPNDVFGSWKGAIASQASNGVISISPGSNPSVKNGWNLGTGSDTPDAGFSSIKNEGYGTEVRWNTSSLTYQGKALQKKHIYRLQIMIHDGDQNKTGGDVGEACMTVSVK